MLNHFLMGTFSAPQRQLYRVDNMLFSSSMSTCGVEDDSRYSSTCDCLQSTASCIGVTCTHNGMYINSER